MNITKNFTRVRVRYCKEGNFVSVRDRAVIVKFMVDLNCYTISIGIFPKYLHGDDIISIPLEVEEKIQVGTIVHKDMILSRLGEIYSQASKKVDLILETIENGCL